MTRASVCTTCMTPTPCPCAFGRARARTLEQIAAEEATERASQTIAARALQLEHVQKFTAHTPFARAIPVGVRSAIVDRWLRTRDPNEAIGIDFNIAGSTVTRIVREEIAKQGLDTNMPMATLRLALQRQAAAIPAVA